MRAIVLVGGEGTRLRPLTWRTPKALVPVLGRPLLEHLLLNLERHGVTHVTLAMTHRTEAIRDAFGDGSRLGIALDYAYEDTPLGSGGAIAGIVQTWTGWSEPFIVVNGDVITDLDVGAMVANHREKQALLSLSLHEVEDPSPFGVVDIADDGRIRRFVEKPKREDAPSRLINAGTWVFDSSLIDRMDATQFNRVEDSLFPTLCSAGEAVYGFHQSAYWADVGNPTTLLRVNLDMAQGIVRSPASTPTAPGLYIDPTSVIEDGAQVEAPAVVGAGSRIASGALVQSSVLWDGVDVERAARVESSILASGVRVGAGAVLSGTVVAHQAAVAAGTKLDGVSVEPADLEGTARR